MLYCRLLHSTAHPLQMFTSRLVKDDIFGLYAISLVGRVCLMHARWHGIETTLWWSQPLNRKKFLGGGRINSIQGRLSVLE